MSSGVILILVFGMLIIGGVIALAFFFLGNNEPKNDIQSNLKNLIQAQRANKDQPIVAGSGIVGSTKQSRSRENLAVIAAAETVISTARSKKDKMFILAKRLKYARWPVTAPQFRVIQYVSGFLMMMLSLRVFALFLSSTIGILTYLIIGSFLDRAVYKRFKEFDKDYPTLLMSYVSLLKTGMNAIHGLDQAAKGLDEDAIVRLEVELLVERLRLGFSEDQAIGSFGEDIEHPELELFVQSLILSRKVGGTLSTTLERLAKQVRKRQQFREQAIAAVGMERSSLYAVASILGALLVYLCYMSPDLILPAWSDPLGRKIMEGSFALILFGFYWSKQVSKLKI